MDIADTGNVISLENKRTRIGVGSGIVNGTSDTIPRKGDVLVSRAELLMRLDEMYRIIPRFDRYDVERVILECKKHYI